MLPFDISVLVCPHASGSTTVRVLGPAGLVGWGVDRDALMEDLTIALTDRLERSHPSLLHRFQAPRGRELVVVQVDDPRAAPGVEEPEPRALPVDVVVEPDVANHRAFLPALDLRLWLEQDDGLEEAVRALVDKVLEPMTYTDRLRVRLAGGMELHTLKLEVAPAPLDAFTGEHAGKMLLPEPEPERTAEEKKADERPKTPMLDNIATELTAKKDRLDGAIGREAEVAEILRLLERPGASVVVVGPPLSGKTAVIEEVVRRLEDRRGWFLDASRLVNTDGWSDWREQTLRAAVEVGESDGVWLVGNPLSLLDAGKHVASEMNVAQVLKPFLSAGQLRVLGECSDTAWGQLEGRDLGFARLFTPYRLEDPGAERSPAILQELGRTLPVPVTREGVDAVGELARRYGPVSARLGWAAHFLRRLAAEARSRGLSGPLGRVEAIQRFCSESGMPELLVRDDLPLDTDALQATFAKRLVGQDVAVRLLVDLVAVIKGGMSDLDRPLGSFLFVGPTGVGKTEAAKTLAGWLFGPDRTRLLRFDMSEMSGPDCVARLLDPSSGLVAAVRRQPFAVVLLDEIEKAHPAVFDLLLQVLGEARLSDANGQVADFRNTVVLLTSNLGVGSFRRPTGFGTDVASALQDHILAEVQTFFRPELFNRIDRVVPFASLGADAIHRIASLELEAVKRRPGLRTRGIALSLDEEALAWVAERGVDPAYGARPLKRAVQTHLVGPMARHLAGAGQPPALHVSRGEEALVFRNQGRTDALERHDRLQDALERLGELRHLAVCVDRASLVAEARNELRLVDRLMESRRFWADKQAAEARSAALEDVRSAIRALTDAKAGVEAVEDLLHEAWMARDSSDLDELVTATDEASDTLWTAILTVAGCRTKDPHTAQLFVHRSENDPKKFKRALIGHYLHLAEDEGWVVRFGDAEWPTNGLAHEKMLQRMTKGTEPVIRFFVKGPHAGTLLRFETGVHIYKDPSLPIQVPVRSAIDGALRDEPPTNKLRRYDPGKKQVVDLQSKLTTTLVARTSRSLRKLLQLRLLVGLLGPEIGKRVWKANRG